VTISISGGTVAAWDVPGCAPGPSCATSVAGPVGVRLDLHDAVVGTPVPIIVTASAPGATTGTARITLTPLARPAGLQYFAVDHGGIAMAANTVVTCLPSGEAKCTEDNNDSAMARVSVGAGTIDSSSADLSLPAGAVVEYASLRWGGSPSGAPDPKALNTVQLTPPGGQPVPVKGTVRMQADAAYSAQADVTALVRGLGQPNGTYTVADVQTGEGSNQFGGWALVIAYHAANAPRQVLAVFDNPATDPAALTPLNRATPLTYSLSLAGFPARAAAADVQLGVVGYEGDRGLTGDSVTVGSTSVGTKDNFFASRIDVGGAARNPSLDNQYGFDADLVTVPKAEPPNAGTLDVNFTDGGNDTVYVGAVTLALPV
jgi:hypothetical protein